MQEDLVVLAIWLAQNVLDSVRPHLNLTNSKPLLRKSKQKRIAVMLAGVWQDAPGSFGTEGKNGVGIVK